MSIVCHLRAAFADPGIIKKNMDPPEELDLVEVKYCRKCDLSWKPERAHHCSECGHCIYKMDHHCPWVNNCVGVRNQKYFIQFVGYVGISSALLSLYMVLSFYYLLTEKSKDHMKKSGYPTAFIVSIISFIVGILFSFFTFELMQEQIESIEEN
jgi:palmitoyltransferase